MGLGRAEKGPGAFFGLSRPFFVLSRPNKDREGSERVPEGLGRRPGGGGRHLKAFRVSLGHFLGGSGHLGRPFRPFGSCARL